MVAGQSNDRGMISVVKLRTRCVEDPLFQGQILSSSRIEKGLAKVSIKKSIVMSCK